MTSRLWVLGSRDNEMRAIEHLLTIYGENFAFAYWGGKPCTGAGAFQFTHINTWGVTRPISDDVWGDQDTTVFLVECFPSRDHDYLKESVMPRSVVLDHHFPDDNGWKQPPDTFMASSSLGQVISELARLGKFNDWDRIQHAGPLGVFFFLSGRWYVQNQQESAVRIPNWLTYIAAADHCLGHAYQGRCPGIDPEVLYQKRIELKVSGLKPKMKRKVLTNLDNLLDAVVSERRVFRLGSTKVYDLGFVSKDDPYLKPLTEYACMKGIPLLYRTKIDDVCTLSLKGYADRKTVLGFKQMAQAHKMWGVHADPVRGIAGGHFSEKRSPGLMPLGQTTGQV